MHTFSFCLAASGAISQLVAATPLNKRTGWPAGGPTFTVNELGSIFDDTFPGISRDGGGSGRANGYNTLFFSDSYGTDKQGNSYFVSNTLTYYGYVSFTSTFIRFAVATTSEARQKLNSFVPHRTIQATR